MEIKLSWIRRIFLIGAITFFIADFSSAIIYTKKTEAMSIRQMGMGGAYTAVCNDEQILSQNPAGLYHMPKQFEDEKSPALIELPIINVMAGVPVRLVDRMDSIIDTVNYIRKGKVDMDGAFRIMSSIDRLPVGFLLSLPLDFKILTKRIGISLDTSMDMDILPVYGLPPSVNVESRNCAEFKVGIAIIEKTIGPGVLKAGAAVKAISIASFEDYIDIGTAVDLGGSGNNIQQKLMEYVNENALVGYGAGANLGVLYTIFEDITVGVAANDAPTYLFRKSFSTNTVYKGDFLMPNIKIGVSYHLPFSLGFLLNNTVIACDLQNLFNRKEYSFPAKIHIGASTDLISTRLFAINIAAGLNKGYGTVSTSLKLIRGLRIGVGYWQEEDGYYVNTRPDQKYVAEVALRF